MKMDTQREYDVVVIGEEPHLAYNRVALTSYFNHRKIEELFMNPKEWVCLVEVSPRIIFNELSSTTACPPGLSDTI